MINLVYLFAHAGASYISMYLLMPKYLFTRRYTRFALLLLLNIIVFSCIIAAGFYFIFRNIPNAVEDIFKIESIIPATFFSTASTVVMLSAIKLFQSRRQAERRNTLLAKEKLEAELNYLKAQINPHFLFNAINNIYFLIKKDRDAAAEMLLKFSELLRYQLYDCNTNFISIATEVAYLENFIELEKIRKGENVSVSFTNNVRNNFQITPLLLIPFVENAFKYVSTTQQNNYIHIKLDYHVPYFEFMVENSKTGQVLKQKSGGIGLENVKRRLNLLYDGAHSLHINDANDCFHVHLKINVSHAD